MKKILLILCMLLPFLFPSEKWGEMSATCPSVESAVRLSALAPSLASATCEEKEIYAPPLLDDSNEKMVAGNVISLPSHRHYSSRPQSRSVSHLLHDRHFIKVLSHYLTALTHHIFQTYTTLKIPSRQRSVDNYVFAYRHIII